MSERLNFLILYTDQQQGYQLGCMNHPDLKTPNIDSLANSGILFQRNYTPNTVCMPTRNSLITGLNPRGHHVTQNGCRTRLRIPTIPGILASNGYRTHAIGKMHLEPNSIPIGYTAEQINPSDFPEAKELWMSGKIDKLPLPYYGFETVELENGNGDGVYGDYLHWLHNIDPAAVDLLSRKNPRKPSTGAWNSWKSSLPSELHVNRWIADRTIEFFEERTGKSQPFFCLVSFPDPHFPWCPSHPYDEIYDPSQVKLPVDADWEFPKNPESVDSYINNFLFESVKPEQIHGDSLREITAHAYGMITHVDDEIGRILQTLTEKGLSDNTVVFFMSDHGEMLGKRGLLAKGPFNFEEIIRVPLIISCPSKFIKSKLCSSITSSLDVPATMLDLAGCSYPENPWALASSCKGLPDAMPGFSLSPILTGNTDKVRNRALVEYDDDYTGSTKRCRLRSIVTEQYKLNYFGSENYGEIYDLKNDPEELENLWNEPAAHNIRTHLMSELVDEVISTESWIPRRLALY